MLYLCSDAGHISPRYPPNPNLLPHHAFYLHEHTFASPPFRPELYDRAMRVNSPMDNHSSPLSSDPVTFAWEPRHRHSQSLRLTDRTLDWSNGQHHRTRTRSACCLSCSAYHCSERSRLAALRSPTRCRNEVARGRS